MGRILVVYATKHGQTRAVADAIAVRLRSRGHKVESFDVAGLGSLALPDTFDAIVLGSYVHAGRHDRKLTRLARRNRQLLEKRPSGFFSVCMAASHPEERSEANGYLARFAQKSEWRPRHVASIAGALAYRRYNPLLRWFMKQLSLRAGGATDTSRDHVFTDWGAVERFADDMATELGEPWRPERAERPAATPPPA